MLEEDIDDTHLCIKCSRTIIGLENYVQHRKNACTTKSSNRDIVHTDHPYGTFDFNETTYHDDHHHHHHHHHDHDHHKSEEVEKPGKSLSESYDLPYELGADVFFSSLELQSSSKRTLPTTTSTTTTTSSSTNNANNSNNQTNIGSNNSGGSNIKHSTSSRILTRKAAAALLSNHEPSEDEWIGPPATTTSSSSNNNPSDNLMKAVRDISGNKKCETTVFKLITFQHDSPEPEQDQESEDDDGDDPDDVADDDDDDDIEEDYENASVPVNHTGGKWKPDNQNTSNIRHHVSLLRNSPSTTWDDRHNTWDSMTDNVDLRKSAKIQEVQDDFDHDFNPPPGHTKGKWIPGTKVVKLDYKEDVEIEKIYSDQYWCNTCNRKLASKILYERHLKSNLHLKRSEPEQELEQATVKMITFSERIKKPSKYLNPTLYVTQTKSVDETEKKLKDLSTTQLKLFIKKRKRRKYFIKCETCKTRLPKYLLGKHLISHYHYRRMILNPQSTSKSYDMILENMDRIVKQAPYQCQPCQFYTNTETNFLCHWNTNSHRDITEGPGRFWCSFCKFECEDNNQMRRHLLSMEHKDVVLAINRSVPIIIGKKRIIECVKCKQIFRYNIELRKHADHCTAEPIGTASNDYQSKFECNLCSVICKSRLSLQRHEFLKHQKQNFFCSICKMNFGTADEAKRHRTTTEHKINSAIMKNNKILTRKCQICSEVLENVLELKNHLKSKHPDHKCLCPHCGQSFILPQEVGRHIRDKQCHLLPSTSTETKTVFIPISTVTSVSNPLFLTTLSQSSSSDCTLLSPSPKKSKTIKDAKTMNLTETGSTIIKNQQFDKDKTKEIDENNGFFCDKCNFRSSMKAELLYHEIFHNEENLKDLTKLKFPCPICKKLFRKHSLRCHLRQHTDERIFSCQYCEMNFARKSNLKNHIINRHEIEKKKFKNTEKMDEKIQAAKFQCDTCGKFFKRRYSLQQHISVHGERDKKFSCPIELCIFIGRNKSDLKSHLNVHSIEKNYKCDYEGCNYMGKTLQLLKKHIKKHKPIDREFSCPECSFTARIPGHMKRHMRIHTGEKPYKCPYCTYTCNNSENLRKHVLQTSLHAGKYLYECKFCDSNSVQFKTNFQREYRAHLVITHQIETDLNEYLNI